MHLLITAGPTREPVDAVRFIGNRSSGRMGLALAEAALAAGHGVTLLLGPVPCPPELAERVALHRFESTADLQALLAEHFPRCDRLIMAAAVADYRPARVAPGKLQRGQSSERLTIELEPTTDVVAELGAKKKPEQRVVAFALEEPERLEARAAEKMRRKHADAIVANPLGTMESDQITAVWLTATGQRETPPAASKAGFARWLIDRVAAL